MPIDRRHFLVNSAAIASVVAVPARVALAAPISALGRDVTSYGVKAGSDADQTRALQKAIDDTARLRVPLALPPSYYRTGPLSLPDGAQLTGIRGASRLVFTGGPSMFSSQGANFVNLSNITLDGAQFTLPQRRGLIHCIGNSNLQIDGCDIIGSGGSGIWLELVSGAISNNAITDTLVTSIVSFDARGLRISGNVIRGASDNGIEILRNAMGDDGTLVVDNRVEDIKAGPGGSGQYGNAINAFRAGNVIVRGNRIRNCDFSAVRGNSASNIQITGNSVSDVREVALYSEFSFEGAVIANNTVDGAAVGVSVCNFDKGGRLATVQGNIIRNLLARRPVGTSPDDPAGVGIYVEADSAVNANVIENAPAFGIIAGWGNYLRDVAITGNVVRNTPVGIGVSVVSGAGTAMVEGNVISGATTGAIVGLDHARPVSGNLAAQGAETFAQIRLGTNQIR